MIDFPKEIPNKSDFPQVKKLDRQIIRTAVLLGLDNRSAYALYHPSELDSVGRLNEYGKKQSDHFWSYGKNREYREAYEKCVEEFINRGSKRKASEDIAIDEGRKDKALKALLNRAMSLVEDNDALDPDTLKTLTEIFKKTGLLKDEVEQEMRPIRVLPLRCWGDGCRYRLFCESMVLEGSAIDECQICKARVKAEELGYKFKDTELLNIPEDVVKRLEEKNDIKLEDIISGRIPN